MRKTLVDPLGGSTTLQDAVLQVASRKADVLDAATGAEVLCAAQLVACGKAEMLGAALLAGLLVLVGRMEVGGSVAAAFV